MEMKKGEIAMLILSVFLVANIAISFLVPGYREHLSQGIAQSFSWSSSKAPSSQPMEIVCSGAQDPLAKTATSALEEAALHQESKSETKTLLDYAPNITSDILALKYSASGSQMFGIQEQDPLLVAVFASEVVPSRMILFSEAYPSIKRYFTSVPQKIYEVKEVNNFFAKSFYLNSIKNDETIRFVTQIGEYVVGFEVEPYWYPILRAHLTKK